jgi:hypothetical protein
MVMFDSLCGSCPAGKVYPQNTISEMKTVKLQLILCSVLADVFLAGCETENESQLQAKAKISKADAQAIALTKVPNGTVKDCELEREHGKLIWTFGFTTPDSKDITEVNVDALTGAVVNVEHEKTEI